MATIDELLQNLRRPRILIRAARLGVTLYDAKQDYPEPTQTSVGVEDRIKRLAAHEDALEQERREGDAGYDMHVHIRVLTALLAEARPFLHRQKSAFGI